MTTHLLQSPFGEISVVLSSATTGRATAGSLKINRVEYAFEMSFEACEVSALNLEGIRLAPGCYFRLSRKGTSAAWNTASSAARKKLELYLFPLLRGIMSNPDNAFDAHMGSLARYEENLATHIADLKEKLAYAEQRKDEYKYMAYKASNHGRVEDAPFCGKPVGTFGDTKACKRSRGHEGKCDHMTTFYVSLDGC